MAYENNGIERSLKVEVTKKVGGNVALGYPKTYDGQGAFPGYAALTDTEFRRLSDAEFTTRYNDFVAYVQGVEAGSDFSEDIVGDGASRANPGKCLAVATTTTTAAPTVYSFTVRTAKFPVDACTGTVRSVYSDKAVPQVGDILYKDYNLTQPYDIVDNAAMLFIEPTIYGSKTILVTINPVETQMGEILDILNGYDCNPQAEISTTTLAPNAQIQVIDNNTPSVIIEGQAAIDITEPTAEGYSQLMFTVNNIGTTPLTLNASIDNEDDFTLVVDPSGVIQPGLSLTGLIRYGTIFTPGPTDSEAVCVITLDNDSVNNNQFTFSVKYDDVN